jgi:hypothetical protein
LASRPFKNSRFRKFGQNFRNLNSRPVGHQRPGLGPAFAVADDPDTNLNPDPDPDFEPEGDFENPENDLNSNLPPNLRQMSKPEVESDPTGNFRSTNSNEGDKKLKIQGPIL